MPILRTHHLRGRLPVLPLVLTMGFALGVVPIIGSVPAARAQARSPVAADRPVRYRLGPGDRLRVAVFRMEGYDTTTEVMSDGTLNLPRLDSLSVWGLTIDEAKARITAGYAQILRHPIVYLDLVQARPVRVSVSGEVQRPGLYSIGQGGINQLVSSGTGAAATTIQTAGSPTLVDALQKAGGITSYGDLRRVTIQRQSNGPGSPVKTLQYDFLQVLQSGAGPAVNPLLYDGDSVLIPRAEHVSEAELLKVASSTFAPDTISVNVVGEVVKPGAQAIKANSPLSHALLSAGGLTPRANASNVRLLRIEPNGTIQQVSLTFNPVAPLGSKENPPLQQGDVVVVSRHPWAAVSDGLRSAVEPVGPIINAASLFRLLGMPLF